VKTPWFEPSRAKFYVLIENPRRIQHTPVVGKSGVGKCTALVNWAVEDISQGDALAFFDSHGDAINEILRTIPRDWRNDTVLWLPLLSRLLVHLSPSDVGAPSQDRFGSVELTVSLVPS
jgi:hypothetical protein